MPAAPGFCAAAARRNWPRAWPATSRLRNWRGGTGWRGGTTRGGVTRRRPTPSKYTRCFAGYGGLAAPERPTTAELPRGGPWAPTVPAAEAAWAGRRSVRGASSGRLLAWAAERYEPPRRPPRPRRRVADAGPTFP